MFKVAGGTDAAVVHFLDPRVATLSDNIGSEINFIVRRPDTWTELHNQISRRNSKFLSHRVDCAANYS